MHRFFVSFTNISGNRITISDKGQVHHIKRVLRLRPEDKVTVFDKRGNEYDCLIESIDDVADLTIQKRLPASEKNELKITIACAIPKKAKFDEIVDKLTQLGAVAIIPMLTERVIAHWGKEKFTQQQKRWERIALAAAAQSKRRTIPVLEPVTPLRELLKRLNDFDLKLIPTLSKDKASLRGAIEKSSGRNILILIGPEGDFTEDELRDAQTAGCIPVSLGETVLRVETAAVAAVSFIRLYDV